MEIRAFGMNTEYSQLFDGLRGLKETREYKMKRMIRIDIYMRFLKYKFILAFAL